MIKYSKIEFEKIFKKSKFNNSENKKKIIW